MKILQKTIERLISPEALEKMKAETNQWQVRCLVCGEARPLWEAGGIRSRNSFTSRITWTFADCRTCGAIRKSIVERAPGAPEDEPPEPLTG